MFRKIALTASALAISASAAMAAGGHAELTDYAFAHEGPFGKFDQFQLQRGLQVYTEVCAACHGLKYVPIRTLSDEGGPQLPEDQVRAYATQFTVTDEETGEDREGKPTDHFPVSGMEGAPDLSMMAKARAGFHGPYGTGLSQLFNGMGGPEYIYSILTHYEENPECAPDGIDGFYYNTSFPNGGVPDSCKDEHGVSTVPGSWIAMPPPLADDQVTYADGTAATVSQMSADVSSFLMWAAEPKLMGRKEAGFKAVVFLIILGSLLYLTNKRIWAGVKGKKVA
ncbi:cytochrome c1 [Rhodobacteraceae bacterium HSP-20]|uniref:Cytochrome c1 n=1 Tax=Paragemmobacter amnigenus TaxID=2852097 RepID=A0ABS6J2N0_9RHOB|nr:cytochrome c1 [Rhodobacter amnigenus]MBU9698014.1 cytochrome c1 [Rhodobacter amnigenus]MBV4389241.1 cytochrome c1 [Rhodobacter amnigenus]